MLKRDVNESVLEVTNLSRQFSGTMALDGISLRVQPGSVYGLVGANGAGKTTLIKLSPALPASTPVIAYVLGAAMLLVPIAATTAAPMGHASYRHGKARAENKCRLADGTSI